MAGRVLDVAVHLLDHQLVDADGGLAGKVDDLELRIEADGSATVVALLSGPGVLAQRAGHRTYGQWRERLEAVLEPGSRGSSRIPWRAVRSVDSAVRLSATGDDLASYGTERWVRQHVIRHIPGARSGS